MNKYELRYTGIYMALPDFFCWTRFGVEAGEAVEAICARKEIERKSNDGIFLWGIGNAVGPSIRRLVEVADNPEAVFSPIRSQPRQKDMQPERIVRWTRALDLDGGQYELPFGSIVTSRLELSSMRQCHYALVCASELPVEMDMHGEQFEFDFLRNLSTGRPVGASQVTAVVQRANQRAGRSDLLYRAAMRVRLVYPYFVQLLEPVPMARGAV